MCKARAGQAVLWGEECSWVKTGGEGCEGSSEGSLGEFVVRSNSSFEAIRLAEATGDGDVWCAATVTAAAPADRYGRDCKISMRSSRVVLWSGRA